MTPDPELGVGSLSSGSRTPAENGHHAKTIKLNGNGKANSSLTRKLFGSGSNTPVETDLHPKLARLVDAYCSSEVAASVKRDIDSARSGGQARDAGQSLILRSYRRASWWQQFKILSGRCFKNLYRNPMLMWSHYAVAIIVAGESRSKGLALVCLH